MSKRLSWTTMVLADYRHRPLAAVALVFSVALAVAVLLLSVALSDAFEQRAIERQEAHQQQTEEILKGHEDEIRKITKNLGFNVEILPIEQDLSSFYADGYASETMPESYVDTLANTDIVTVDHLLPRLFRKITWPEQHDRTVLAIGVKGQVPLAFKDPKKPIQQPVPEGTIVLGYELHRGAQAQVGDTVVFRGLELTVKELHPQRGTEDDITLWINLDQMQGLFDMDGRINSILALNCNCTTVDRLGEIRAEIGKILPGTQIIEYQTQALARAEARNSARDQRAEMAKVLTAEIARERASQRQQITWMVALALTVSALWIAATTWLSVRARMGELALLRALGASTAALIGYLLLSLAYLGVAGAIIGQILGIIVVKSLAPSGSVDTETVATVAVAAVIWPVVLGWLPVLWASRRDPAPILGAEA